MVTATKKTEEKINTLNSSIDKVRSVFDSKLPAREYTIYYNKGTSKKYNKKEYKTTITFKFVSNSSRYDLMQQIYTALSKSRMNPRHLVNSNLSGMGHIQFTNDMVTYYVIVKYKNINAFRSLRYTNPLMDEKKWSKRYKNRSPDTSEEHGILYHINQSIYKLGNESPVDIILKPNNVYRDIVGFIPGETGKHADFVGIDKDLNELCFISHKKGSSPKQFQQYSGISIAAGSNIHNDSEVEDFRKVIASKDRDDFKNQSFSRKINSKELKSKAVFGPDYDSGNVGHNSCTHFVQGNVTISRTRPKKSVSSKALLVISFNSKNVHRNNINQLDRSGYRPVLGARRGESTRSVRYMSDTVSGVRGGIFPEAYIEGRNNQEI